MIVSGTFTNEMVGQPTGKKLTHEAFVFWRVAKGKIIEEKVVWDEHYFWHALGAEPPPVE